MKCTIPEISWHNRDPVLSVDVQRACKSENFERLATGGTDSHVVIWHVEIQVTGVVKVEFAADLQRHQKAVNVVRFSPSGEFLASADDESAIIIWKQKTDQDAPDLPLWDSDITTKEQWLGIRVLRGHVEDVYDLSWSPDSLNLISGSVDNSAILWDVHKGRNVGLLKEHKGFVQGVAWDPRNQYVATLSGDRMCRVYSVSSKKLVSRVSKAQLPVPDNSDLHGKVVRLFHDDTLKSFFRRLCFSPDGQLLIVPSGIIENPNSDKNSNAAFIFTRRMFNRPAVYLPSNNQHTVAVRCCPLLFELRDRESMFALPYRMVLAVATQNSVLLYDTQQPEPFGIVSNIHYTRLTDLTWSGSGRMLVVSSTDGYCSIVTFAVGELGVVYEPKKDTPNKERANEEAVGIGPMEGNDNSSEKEVVCKDTARVKLSEGTDKSEDYLNSQEIHGSTIPEDSCASDTILNNHKCDKVTGKFVKSPTFKETVISSSLSEKTSENTMLPDLQKTPESFRSTFCGKTKSVSKQEKTPRRIKPVLLSSPRKVFAKPFHSNDVSERKQESSSVKTSKRICPVIPIPNNSHRCSKDKETSGGYKSPLLAPEETLTNEISSDNLPMEDSEETTKMDVSVETMVSSDTEKKVASSNEPVKIETDPVFPEDEGGTALICTKPVDAAAAVPSNYPECMEIESNGSLLTKIGHTTKFEPMETSMSAVSPASPLVSSVVPVQDKRTPRRVQLITLSSPKSKKKLL